MSARSQEGSVTRVRRQPSTATRPSFLPEIAKRRSYWRQSIGRSDAAPRAWPRGRRSRAVDGSRRQLQRIARRAARRREERLQGPNRNHNARPSRMAGSAPVRASSYAVDFETPSTDAASDTVKVAGHSRLSCPSSRFASPMTLVREHECARADAFPPSLAVPADAEVDPPRASRVRSSSSPPTCATKPLRARDETVRHTCRFRKRNPQVFLADTRSPVGEGALR